MIAKIFFLNDTYEQYKDVEINNDYKLVDLGYFDRFFKSIIIDLTDRKTTDYRKIEGLKLLKNNGGILTEAVKERFGWK